MVLKYICYGVRLNMILLCVPCNRGLTSHDFKVLNQLKYLQKPVHIVLTKIDQVPSNTDLVKILTETSQSV